MLYVTGSIYDWHTYSHDNSSHGIKIFIDINHTATIDPNALDGMKKKITNYFIAMKSDQFYKEKVFQYKGSDVLRESPFFRSP